MQTSSNSSPKSSEFSILSINIPVILLLHYFTTMLQSLFDSSSPPYSLDRESRSGLALNEEHEVVSKQTVNVPYIPSDIYGHQQFNASYQQQPSLANMLLVNTGVLDQAPSLDHESQSGWALNEVLDVLSKQTENVPSDIYGQQQFNESYQQQQSLPNMLPVNSGVLHQVPQPEFFGHNIVKTAQFGLQGGAPYPCYGGSMAAYGPPIIQPQYVDVTTRMLLAPETGPEPVFVNPKQYHAILRRRQSRIKAENEKKLIKSRKPYLHESRHLHAMNRARGSRGRFAKREEVDSSNKTASGSLKPVQPESSQTKRGESTNSQSYHVSLGNNFLSSYTGDDWLNISSLNEG